MSRINQSIGMYGFIKSRFTTKMTSLQHSIGAFTACRKLKVTVNFLVWLFKSSIVIITNS
jgi:hypothetical protein